MLVWLNRRLPEWRPDRIPRAVATDSFMDRPERRFRRAVEGASVVEFALIAPVLLLMGLGLIVFGFTLNNKSIVVHAAAAGIQQFTISRGASTPFTATTATINSAAVGLTPFGLTSPTLTITLSVNGAACASDSACATALSANASQSASVRVSYPCSLQVMGFSYGGGASCQVFSTATGMIQ
jgi:Flp pilus assembly protein TadG